ncbi:MAG: sialate O-acetylesterase [Sphingomicrobium sp.]
MPPRSLLIVIAFAASGAAAAPTIDPQFGDHSVIQRGRPVVLSGTAAPSERLTVNFANESRRATADTNGRWEARFPARSAGGPFTIRASGAEGSASSSDVAVGDVWLCSGQSNMEYPVRRALNSDGEVQNAGDAGLRLMKVPQQMADLPARSFAKLPSWKPTSPDAVKDFSAACYFMARELRASEKVPIGAIDDSWGATPVREWMDEASVRAGGEGAIVDLMQLHRTNPPQALRAFGDVWGAWWRSKTNDAPSAEPWRASDRLGWKAVPEISYWDAWAPEWKTFDGAVWFRRRFTLTPGEAAHGATLSLGVFDDMDQTWVNGVPVGGTNDWSAERYYALPAGGLHAGQNEVLVYVRDNWGPGGMAGPAEKVRLALSDGTAKPLGDGWQFSVIDNAVGPPPTPPWSGVTGVSMIYNAMIAPLGPLGLKGVAWYQGEADVGEPGYDRRLAAWMANWRAQFRDPQLPFLIVGLAGWGTPQSEPKESGWAALIDEQRIAVGRDRRTALISAIDLGEWTDIHPANKQEVGRRLALAARSLAYGSDGKIGPLPLNATRAGNAVIVRFTKRLRVLSGSRPTGFELCAQTCRFADARVNGDIVEIAGDGAPVTRVRYAWADYPIVNLYDEDMLPAPVFELPVQ